VRIAEDTAVPTVFRTIGQLATELNVPRWRLAYLIDRGDLPAPSAQVPGRRLFSEADVTAVREALARLQARGREAAREG
jgi:hypothetical protein